LIRLIGQWHFRKAVLLALCVFVHQFTIYEPQQADFDPADTSTVLTNTVTPMPPTPTPTPTPPPASATPKPKLRPTAAPAQANSRYGIAVSLTDLSPAALDRALNDIKSMGVGWIRFDVEWSNIEHKGPGQYDWTDYDRVAQGITKRGLQALAIIDYTPPWARRSDCPDSSKCAPRDPAEFANFAGKAVARYSPLGIRTWEIWNEPNVDDYYKPAPNIQAYTALLKSAYAAIKSVDPSATVLTGGTAPAPSDGINIKATDFLAGIYAAGGKGSFDAVAHHPYTFPYTVDNAFPGGAWSDLTTLYNIMTNQGDGAKKVWSTEYGAPTGGPGVMISTESGPHPDSVYVSESLQATIAAAAIAKYKTYPWTGPIFWYTYQDAGTDPSTIENFFGLLRADGARKPAYETFRSAIR
jgi:polysaccharide biosynthesis protein PslG